MEDGLPTYGFRIAAKNSQPKPHPIEEVFSSVKAYLKAHECIIHDANDIKTVIKAAFMNISKEDCRGWFSDCGYMSIACTVLFQFPNLNLSPHQGLIEGVPPPQYTQHTGAQVSTVRIERGVPVTMWNLSILATTYVEGVFISEGICTNERTWDIFKGCLSMRGSHRSVTLQKINET